MKREEPKANRIAFAKMNVKYAMTQLGCGTEEELIEMCNNLVNEVKYLVCMGVEI